MIFFQSICGWPSKPHLFNFMHQWDDTSCFVQCDSLLHCITQRAEATRHAKLTWASNPGNLRQQDPPLQLALFDKPRYSPLSLLFFFCTNDENGVFWKRCLDNGCGMWIIPGCTGVELMQFLCFGLLRRVGSLWFLGSLGKGSGWLWCFQGCAKLVFNTGKRLQFPQLLELHLPALRTSPVLQRGCGFNKPRRNFPFSTAPLHAVWAPAATWPLWLNSSVEWRWEGHCCSSSPPLPSCEALRSSPLFPSRQENRNIAWQTWGCFVGPSAATLEVASIKCLLSVPEWSIIMDFREKKRLMLGMNISSPRLWHATCKPEHPVLCSGQNFCLISDICQWLLVCSWVK